MIDTPSGSKTSWLKRLGPGLVTGAADDDPSGIATYSQTGAAQGFGLLWVIWLTFPLMVGIQMISALIGRVTGKGLAAAMKCALPKWLLYSLIFLLFVANAINIAADIAAMGAAVNLLIGGPALVYAFILGGISLLLQIWLPFERYAKFLKLLALALLTYVATVFAVKVPWGEVMVRSVVPNLHWDRDAFMMIVAVFGTTISPFLFFWQASHEVEEVKAVPERKSLKKAPSQGEDAVKRITFDTVIGMAVSNIVAFFIVVTTATVLHAKGVHDIQTTSQAAEALRPVAGRFAFFLFSLGVVGTGLLAVPVLAGSTAFAVAEVFGWPLGLEKSWSQAKGFYMVIIAGMVTGLVLCLTPLDPVKALVWSAFVNGVIAVPIMIVVMILASRTSVMGKFTIGPVLKMLGWIATVIMGAAVVLTIGDTLLPK